MKHFLLITVIFTLLGLTERLSAQIPAIMDANVAWINSGGGSYAGTLTVYLTDSTNVSGVHVNIGSQPSDSDISITSYSGATNGNFSGNGNVSMQNNNLAVSLGTFTYHSNYYIDIKVLLEDNSYKEIAIHSSN